MIKGKIFFLIALLLILMGILFNQWIWVLFFDSDGILALSSKVKIWSFEIFLISVGILLMRHRKSVNLFKILYKPINITFVLFILILTTLFIFGDISNKSILILINIILGLILLIQWKRSNLVVLLLSVSIFSILIELSFLGIEVYNTFTGYREKINTVFLDQNSSSVYRKDSILRFVLNPNVKVKISKSYSDGEIAYENLLFSTDEKGRRISMLNNVKAEKHALFFGGSFVEGVVHDRETLPSRFQYISNNKYKSYNYGVSGYGTGGMYLQLDKNELFEDISQKSGICVYSFNAYHLVRSTGYDYFWLAGAYPNQPLFRLSDEGSSLVGPFKWYELEELKNRIPIYLALKNNSPAFRFLLDKIHSNIGYIFSKEKAVKIINKVIIESKKKYNSHFEGDFYVILWPRLVDSMGLLNKKLLIDTLSKNDINVIDIPEMSNEDEAVIHPRDSHPSAKENNYVAKFLYEIVMENE